MRSQKVATSQRRLTIKLTGDRSAAEHPYRTSKSPDVNSAKEKSKKKYKNRTNVQEASGSEMKIVRKRECTFTIYGLIDGHTRWSRRRALKRR